MYRVGYPLLRPAAVAYTQTEQDFLTRKMADDKDISISALTTAFNAAFPPAAGRVARSEMSISSVIATRQLRMKSQAWRLVAATE